MSSDPKGGGGEGGDVPPPVAAAAEGRTPPPASSAAEAVGGSKQATPPIPQVAGVAPVGQQKPRRRVPTLVTDEEIDARSARRSVVSPRRSYSGVMRGGKPGSTPPGNRFSQQQQGQLKLYDFLPQIQEENVSKNKDANMFANKFANKSAKNTASAVSQSSCGGVNLNPLSLGGVNLKSTLLGGLNLESTLAGGLNLEPLAPGAAQLANTGNRSPGAGLSRGPTGPE